jgi:Protein of unknown function, DUF481
MLQPPFKEKSFFTWKKYAYWCIFLLSFGTTLSAQIINIEEKRFKNTIDTVHWYGEVDFGASLAQVQKEVIQFRTGAQVEYKNDKHLILALGDYSLLKAGGESFDNAAFQHLRYNYKVQEYVAWEAYGQIQNNKLQHIDLRALAGMGIRLRAYKSKLGESRIYVGTSFLYEKNKFKGSVEEKMYLRWSNYLSITAQTKMLKFNSTTYFQPEINAQTAARLSTQNSLSFKLTKKIAFKVNIRAAYDPTVPKGLQFWTYSLENGVKWEL